MSRDRREPEEPVAGARRLAKIGWTGARMAGRTAGARVRGALGDETAGERARQENVLTFVHALGEMRGAACKLGQVLSQPLGVLSEDLERSLEALHWQAPPMHGTLMRLQLRRELGPDGLAAFAHLDREPFAAASLGQVHRGELTDGRAVAVKIQYPGIERSMTTDFRLLRGLATPARLGGRRFARIEEAMDEVERQVSRETDYRREAEHQEAFRRRYRDEPLVVVPAVVPELSTGRVLTMEHLTGVHLEELLASDSSQTVRDRLGSLVLSVFLDQVLGPDFGRLHVDAHPGNYLFLPPPDDTTDWRLGLLDFGCVQEMTPGFLRAQRELWETPIEQQDRLEEIYRRIGLLDGDSGSEPERRRRLFEMQRRDLGPFHRPGVIDFADPAILDGFVDALKDLLALGAIHPDFVLYARTKIGLYTLLRRLGSRVDGHRLLHERLVRG